MISTNLYPLIDDLIGALPPDRQIHILKEALGRAAASLAANGIRLTSPDRLDALQMQALLVQESRDHLEGLRSDRVDTETKSGFEPRLGEIIGAIDLGFQNLPDGCAKPTLDHMEAVKNQLEALEVLQSPDLNPIAQICLNLGLCDALLIKGYVLCAKQNTRAEGFAILDRNLELLEESLSIAGVDVEELKALSQQNDLLASFLGHRSSQTLAIAKSHYQSRFQFIERLKNRSFPKGAPRGVSYQMARTSTFRLLLLFLQHYEGESP